jgi:DSBA-like thioredoxin domain-containing protein
MKRTATPQAVEPIDDEIDHVRGGAARRLILEYGDYECPYSRQAFREIERVEQRLGGAIRFAFRHFPLTEIHPHALGRCMSCSSIARRTSKTTTCGGMPPSSGSTLQPGSIQP